MPSGPVLPPVLTPVSCLSVGGMGPLQYLFSTLHPPGAADTPGTGWLHVVSALCSSGGPGWPQGRVALTSPFWVSGCQAGILQLHSCPSKLGLTFWRRRLGSEKFWGRLEQIHLFQVIF